MKLYTAAVYTNNYMPGQKQHNDLTEFEKEITAKVPNILESYHYVKKQSYIDEMRNNNAKVFLDSGAFSAFNIGAEINIDEYCDFVKTNSDIIRSEDGDLMASVLDGIGDPLKTWQNQTYMEQQGAKPLPCFHYGEDTKYLDWYVKYYSYITIGGMVGRSKEQLIIWLDRIFNNHILDNCGNPRLKVHAFGITSFDIMKRYPWYSVDSSSWIQSTAFGVIVTPKYGPIQISEKSPSRKVRGQHFSTFSEIEQIELNKMLEAQGFTYERLSTTYQSRAAYNLYAYGEINKLVLQEKTNTLIQPELF